MIHTVVTFRNIRSDLQLWWLLVSGAINWATSLSLGCVVRSDRSLISIRKRWSGWFVYDTPSLDGQRKKNCHPFIYVRYVIHINRWWNKSVARLIFQTRPFAVFFLSGSYLCASCVRSLLFRCYSADASMGSIRFLSLSLGSEDLVVTWPFQPSLIQNNTSLLGVRSWPCSICINAPPAEHGPNL